MNKEKIELGDRARDKITGLTGIITAVSHWLNGCVRYGIQPEKLDGGKVPDIQMFDAEQVEIVRKRVHEPKIVVEAAPVPPPAPPRSRSGGPARETKAFRRF